MVQINWNNLKKEDIIKAIDIFDSEQPNYINPKGLFLIFNGNKYPAKMIRKMAYNIKNDTEISEDQFKDGSYTIKLFNKLGFDIIFNKTKYFANDMNNKPKTIRYTEPISKNQKLTEKNTSKNSMIHSKNHLKENKISDLEESINIHPKKIDQNKDETLDLKIGMYLQTYTKKDYAPFEQMVKEISKEILTY